MSERVRAKFRVMSITPAQSNDPNYVATTVSMIPVWEQDGVNKEWSKATPSGKLDMLITNPDAIERFENGKQYFVDITPAD